MVKHYAALFLFLTFSITASTQSGETNHWEMLINSGDTFNYITSNDGEADPAWRSPEFDDASSNLPLFIITTENNMQIPDEPKITAYLGIIFNGEGQINRVSDPHNIYSGQIGIELRGNSTQGFPKKPYSFETRDSMGLNLNISIVGLPPENDWVLRASYLDHTFIRNGLANYMSRQNGFWASRTRLVEVVLNGEYQGIYILMEKLKRDYWRLNITELYPSEITEPEITGGYIWEITGFGSNMGKSRELKYPKIEEVAPEQIEYISSYDDTFRDVMASGNFNDSTTGYHAYIDPASFVNEILVQEAMRNSDAYGWSGYFHKDRLGKINAGPVWDFDQSAGNSSYPDNGVVEGWMFSHPSTNNTPFFWEVLFSDPVFSYAVRHRWETLRDGAFSDEKLLGYIDSIAHILGEAQQREFIKWPVLGEYFWRETNGYDYRNTYQKEVDYLKSFLIRRWQWMDNELAQYENPYPDTDTTVTDTSTNDTTTYARSALADRVLVYPNPVRDKVTFRIPDSGTGSFSFNLYNHLGEMILQQRGIPAYVATEGHTLQLGNEIPSGIYFYRIILDGDRHFNGRIVKIE